MPRAVRAQSAAPPEPPAPFIDHDGAPWMADDGLLRVVDDLIERLQKWLDEDTGQDLRGLRDLEGLGWKNIMEEHAHLEPGRYYHIFNRGINGANIFLEERNYAYFLNLYAKHIAPVVETFAYCLLRNHFHLLVRIKASAETLSATQAF